MRYCLLIVGMFGVIACAAGPSPHVADSPPPFLPGYLGCQLKPPENGRPGAQVVQILPDSPAAQAGLKTGDRIVEVDGQPIPHPKFLTQKSKAAGAHATLTLKVRRQTETRSVQVTLNTNPFHHADLPDPAPGLHAVKMHADLPYFEGPEAHPDKHRLDLYVPNTDAPAPVFLWIHGGGWSFGDRKDAKTLGLRFAERGILFAAVSHRMSAQAWADPQKSPTGVTHPAHAIDTARAFAWLHRHIAKYSGDPQRIFIGGHSSGAHLTTLIATNPRFLQAEGLSRNTVRGVVAVEATYDIAHYHAVLTEGLGKDKANAHIHAVFGSSKANWQDASPVRFINDSPVPIFVVTGQEPAFRKYTAQLSAAVQDTTRPVQFYDALDRTHGTVVLMMTRRAPDPVRQAILTFMKTS